MIVLFKIVGQQKDCIDTKNYSHLNLPLSGEPLDPSGRTNAVPVCLEVICWWQELSLDKSRRKQIRVQTKTVVSSSSITSSHCSTVYQDFFHPVFELTKKVKRPEGFQALWLCPLPRLEALTPVLRKHEVLYDLCSHHLAFQYDLCFLAAMFQRHQDSATLQTQTVLSTSSTSSTSSHDTNIRESDFLLFGDLREGTSKSGAVFFPALQIDLRPTNDTQSWWSTVQKASFWMCLFFHCELGHHDTKRP